MTPNNGNSVSLIRKAIILLTVLIVLVVFLIIFQFTDIAFRVWDRLQHTSPGFLIFYLIIISLIAAAGAGLIWKIWTVGRNRKSGKTPAAERKRVSLEELQARAAAARAQGLDTSAIDAEIEAIAAEPQELELAFFGKISTGKSSLIQTLLPHATIDTSIIGGSTATIERYHYENPRGLSLTLLEGPVTTFYEGVMAACVTHVLQMVESNGHSFCYGHFDQYMNDLYHADLEAGRITYAINTEKANELIHSHLFRPPHGWMRYTAYWWLKRKYRIIMWDLVTRDYSKWMKAKDVVDNVKKYARNGSIITFHDSLKSIDKLKTALPQALEWLIKEGYEFKIFE